MCIDAPESTTNSRSLSLRVDAGKHLFSESEKKVTLSYFFYFYTLLASFHAALAYSLLLPLCLLLRPILKFWSVGTALVRFNWANESERRILVSNVRVTCNGFFLNFKRWIWSLHI